MKKLNPNQRKWFLRIGLALYLVLSVLWAYYFYLGYLFSAHGLLGSVRPPDVRFLMVAAIPWGLLIIWFAFKWIRGQGA